jgi:hypothetical protein
MWTELTLAELWGVTPETIEDLCRRGRLHGRFVNGAWEISDAAVEAFLSTRQPKGQPRTPPQQASQMQRLA